LFIEAEVGERILTYQMRLVVLSPNHPDFRDIRQFNLVDDKSPGFYAEGKTSMPSNSFVQNVSGWGFPNASQKSTPVSSGRKARMNSVSEPVLNESSLSTGSKVSGNSEDWWGDLNGKQGSAGKARRASMNVPDFSDEGISKYFPAMIGKALDYEEAVAARADGYDPASIYRFRPTTVKDGKIPEGIPVFRNPVDGQRYFLNYAYHFPRKDAVLYELVMKNRGLTEVWFDYNNLRFVQGNKGLSQSILATAVSPDYETTAPGVTNSIWVLIQGAGWLPQDPVRVIFPELSRSSKSRVGSVPSRDVRESFRPSILYNESGN
jgi:hypothetical protein